MKKPLSMLVLGLALGATGPPAAASTPACPRGAHTWDFTEVFSNADGTIQFLELRECCGFMFETGVTGQMVVTNTHSVPLSGGTTATAPTSNRFFLVATAGFAALPGAPTPDKIIPNGSLPFFFSPGGDTVSYGAPYDTWTFASVPTDGINSLKRDGTVSANDPTNYAGVTGSVDASGSVTTNTCAGDGSYPSTSGLVCPCGNTSTPGSNEGCVNSSNTNGGVLRDVLGSSVSIATDNLRLDAGHPAGNSGLLLVNTSIFPTGVATFDGLACVGGGPRVLPGADNGMSQPFGDVDLAASDGVRNLGSTTPGAGLYGLVNASFPGFFTAGNTYYAQFWFRDVLCGPPPAPCNTPCTVPPPGAANFTNAVTWTATP